VNPSPAAMTMSREVVTERVDAVTHGYGDVGEIINLHGKQSTTAQAQASSTLSSDEIDLLISETSSDSRGRSRGNEEIQQGTNRLTSKALKTINESKAAARRLHKSPSLEILENYNQQPLHVRSRAEQWELPRAVIFYEQFHLGGHLSDFDPRK
jgi:hypothetical protein